MKVRELRTILEHVDPDLDVHISTEGVRGCCHIDNVVRAPRNRTRRGEPPSLMLRGRVLWTQRPPFFKIAGRFRLHDTLLVKLITGE